MSSLSDFMGASTKPKQITSYTSGTGTYVPTADMARCLVRLQAGGAGGATTAGGGGGSMIEFWIRIPIAGMAYAVAASAAANTHGSNSTFGPYTAVGGQYDASAGAVSQFGGANSVIQGNVSATDAALIGGRSFAGVDGGMGGQSGSNGYLAGFPSPNMASVTPLSNSRTRWANGVGNFSGGNSFFGKGGTTGAAPLAGNYGAGGGGHASTPGAGAGGYIEVWDYGV